MQPASLLAHASLGVSCEKTDRDSLAFVIGVNAGEPCLYWQWGIVPI